MPFYDTPIIGDPDNPLCRQFILDPDLWHIAYDHLSKLLDERIWDEVAGGETIAQTLRLISDALDNSVEDLCDVIAQTWQIGNIVASARAEFPEQVLPCDGATYDRVDYPLLYEALDPEFIIDLDTFRVPDLRGRGVIGSGSGGGGLTPRSIDDSGGAETHQLTLGEIPAHVHSEIGAAPSATLIGEIPNTDDIPTPASTGSAGGGGSHNNMQPYRVLHYGIVALNVYLLPESVQSKHPAGVIQSYAGATAPDGWLFCYGQAVSRDTYYELFTAIGTQFGNGDGSTTFNLPDLRGRAPIGLDNLGGSSANRITAAWADTLGGTGGTERHTLSEAEMPQHNHFHNTASGSSSTDNGTLQRGNTNSIMNVETADFKGSGNSHLNTQPSIALSMIIKT